MTGDPGKPHITPQKSFAGSRRLYSHENDFFPVYAITPCLSSENDLPPQNSGVDFTIIVKNPQFQRKSADLRKTVCSPGKPSVTASVAEHPSPSNTHCRANRRDRPLKHKRQGRMCGFPAVCTGIYVENCPLAMYIKVGVCAKKQINNIFWKGKRQ